MSDWACTVATSFTRRVTIALRGQRPADRAAAREFQIVDRADGRLGVYGSCLVYTSGYHPVAGGQLTVQQ